jgi:hypothetical protein
LARTQKDAVAEMADYNKMKILRIILEEVNATA